MKDGDAIAILQAIWDYLYGARIPRQIVSVGPIFGIVSYLFLFSHRDYANTTSLVG